MFKLPLTLMVVGLWSGCGKDEFIKTKTLTSLYLEIGCFFTDTTLILEVLWGRSFSS